MAALDTSSLTPTPFDPDPKSQGNNTERTGLRPSDYSDWHRTVLDVRMIDIDSVETCRRCQQPLALIETLRSGGWYDVLTKPHYVTRNLALLAKVPAYVCVYVVSESTQQRIVAFHVRQIAPEYGEPQIYTPEAWARFLQSLRVPHQLICSAGVGKKGGESNDERVYADT